MKKEVNSVLGIIIIVIVSALLCFLTMFIIGDKKHTNNSNTNNDKNVITDNNTSEDKNDNQENEVKYEKIENIDAIAKEFYDNFIFDNRLLFLNYNNVFKNGNKFSVSNLSSNEKMLITYAYVYWENYKIESDNSQLSVDEFKNYYAKLFGISGYKNINFNGGFCYCQAGLEIVYDATANKFIKKASIEGCGPGPYAEKYLYDKAVQVEDKIKLYVKVGYLRPTFDTNNVASNYSSVYSDPNTTQLIGNDIVDFDISPYKDKLNTLIYTLVKDTNTNNYVLESIEVVK